MALKNVVQWLVCLVLGGIAGYQLRSSQQGMLTPGASAEPPGKQSGLLGLGPSLSGEGPESKKKESDASAGKMSLGERMKFLMEDGYDSKSAKKAIEALSEAELQASLALLAAMPKSKDRDGLRASLYAAWAKLNPNAAWKSAVALDTGDYPSLLGAVAGELVKTRPKMALDLVLSLGMGSKRSAAMRSIFIEWCKVDGAAAIDYFNKHPDLPAASWTISNAVHQMAEKDPQRAGDMALSLVDQQARSNAIQSVLRRWSADDPKAALAWAERIGNVTLRQEAIVEAMGGWASRDPKAAMAAVQEIKDYGVRSTAIQRALSSWFESDPSAAFTYLGNLGDEKLLNQMGWRMTSSDLSAEEVHTLLAKIPDGKPKDEMVRHAVDNDIRKGMYTRAIERLNALPDSTNRDYSLQELGKQWAARDPKAAEAWLKLQPDSSDRDVAVSGFAVSLVRTNVDSALQWANAIPDAGVKNDTLKNIAIRWLGTDPVRANAWLDHSSGWTADEVSRLRENVQKYGSENYSYSVSVKNRH